VDEVTRYGFVKSDGCGEILLPIPDGNWVRYEDYAKLEAQVAEADFNFGGWRAIKKRLEEQVAALTEQNLKLRLLADDVQVYFDDEESHESPEGYAESADLSLGSEFELTAASYWKTTHRVTKIPDEKSDDWDTEEITKPRGGDFPAYFTIKAEVDALKKQLQTANKELALWRSEHDPCPFALENERLTEQLRLLSQPVSDEEQERFMESARQTIADEYMRTWDELASDAMQFSETATDILLDLVRTEASLKAIAARSAAPWKEVKDGN
jgi:hypothetical protein